MSEAIVRRLPADSIIGLTDKGGTVQITISMTLTDPGHAQALMEAIQVALLPLLELRQNKPKQLGTGSESATGLAQCDTPTPARELSVGHE